MIKVRRSASLTHNLYHFTRTTALCLVLLGWWGCENVTENTEYGYPIFHPYKMPIEYRGVDSELEITKGEKNTLKEAITLYHQEQYAGAARKFEEYLQYSPNHLMSEFYGGVAFLASGKPSKAYPLLSNASKDPDSYFETHARWYLSIACLETRKFEQAKVLLINLQKDSTKYSKKAQQILDKHPLFLFTQNNIPTFDVSKGLIAKEEDSNIIIPHIDDDIELKSSKDTKSLEIHFKKSFDGECLLKLYDDQGLLVHMERITNAYKNTKANVRLNYKSSGLYNLLIQVSIENKEKIIPYKIRI